jgi:serine/threonine protein phosphatase PrpC
MGSIVATGLTIRGAARAENQDRVLWWTAGIPATREDDDCWDSGSASPYLSSLRFFAVADGMGGLVDGAKAAQAAVDAALSTFRLGAARFNRAARHLLQRDAGRLGPVAPTLLRRTSDELEIGVQSVLCDTLVAANDAVRKVSAGAGCALLVCAVADGRAFVAHVGDCRAYVLHPTRSLELLTRDHNRAWEPVTSGRMSCEEADAHGLTSQLTQHLGVPTITPDVHVAVLKDGDRLVLCTDGLYRGIGDDRRLAQIASDPSATRAAARLRDAALDLGAGDDVGLVIVDALAPGQLGNGGGVQRTVASVAAPRLRAYMRQVSERLNTWLEAPAKRVGVLGLLLTMVLGAGTGAWDSLRAAAGPFSGGATDAPPRALSKVIGNGFRSVEAEIRLPTTDTDQGSTEGCLIDPAKLAYLTRPGDSLQATAMACNVSVDDLARFNDIADPHTLPTDLLLRLPVPSPNEAPPVVGPARGDPGSGASVPPPGSLRGRESSPSTSTSPSSSTAINDLHETQESESNRPLSEIDGPVSETINGSIPDPALSPSDAVAPAAEVVIVVPSPMPRATASQTPTFTVEATVEPTPSPAPSPEPTPVTRQPLVPTQSALPIAGPTQPIAATLGPTTVTSEPTLKPSPPSTREESRPGGGPPTRTTGAPTAKP